MIDIKTQGLFTEDDIELAWERVCASVGADVKDYFGINVFNSDKSKYLHSLYEELDLNNYSPARPFKYFEPKKCGTQRTKTVLNIKDAIIYQAIADKIGAQLYGRLDQNRNFVFGSVLNENVVKGVSILEEEEPDFYFFEYYVSLYNRFVEGIGDAISSETTQYKLETDITGFFDCIPHSVLLLRLVEFNIDKNLLDLLANCLNVWSGTRDNITLNVGIPQGPPASFLLANILLNDLDELILDEGVKYCRFMDDMRIYAESKNELLDLLVKIDRYLKSYSLSLNASKTAIKLVETNNDYDSLLLDGSGIPIDEGVETDEINDTVDIGKLAEDEIVIQDATQIKNKDGKNQFLSKYIFLTHGLLKDVEDELFLILDKYENNCESLSHEDIRHFLTLSQRWRTLVSTIKTAKKYNANKKLVKVWFFGIKHIFWKTNSFIWNLNHYESLNEFAGEYEKTLQQFKRFEWVKYQLLNLFFKFYPKDLVRHARAIEELKSEESPLVRLGYYSVLVEAIREDSDLFKSYSDSLVTETSEYVKESILSSVHQKHTQVPISTLKEWFLR